MEGKAIIAIKVLALFVYNIVITPLAEVVATKTNGTPPEVVLYFFIIMLFAPEIAAIFSKSFRIWIKSGIEDGDGKLNKSDMKDLLVHMASIYSLRVYVVMALFMIFYSIEIDYIFYVSPLFGAFGLQGFLILRKILPRK